MAVRSVAAQHGSVLADTEAELLAHDVRFYNPGIRAFVLSTQTSYILNNQYKWQKLNKPNNGSGSGTINPNEVTLLDGGCIDDDY